MAAAAGAIIEGEVKRYFPRALFEEGATATHPSWQSSSYPLNLAALILGYLALRSITDFSNHFVESFLLHNFPSLSRDWCFVHWGCDHDSNYKHNGKGCHKDYHNQKGYGKKTACSSSSSPSSSRLRRTQEWCLRVWCVVTVLMRWPGWWIYQIHLWECVRLAVALFAVWQGGMVGVLVVVQGFVWMGKRLLSILKGGEEAEGAAMRGAGRRTMVHFDGVVPPASASTPATPEATFGGGEMPRKHPSSVGMGCFLRDVKLEGVRMQDTFVAKEWNSNRKEDEMVIYHAITTRDKFWDFSFEELKLQHYEETGKFKKSMEDCWPAGEGKACDEEEGTLGQSWGRVLPSWLSSRTFRDSAFSWSTSSERSDVSIAKFNASLAAGARSGPSTLPATPDSLTGKESIVVRRFT